MGNLSTPKSVQKLQTALHAKAKAEADYRFYALYDKISREDILAHAYAQCRSNKGAPGVDGQDFADIAAYGVELLEPIFEADLPPEIYAYRAGRNAQQAVIEVEDQLFHGRPDVVDADLADYFGSIPHFDLMKSVARRIVDPRVLHLIRLWLDCPVEEADNRGRKTRTTAARDQRRGIPQGSPISPLLANLYMRRFLFGWPKLGLGQRLGARLVTYADDLVILCQKGNAEAALDHMRRLMGKLKLTVNEEKTRICKVPAETFDFLGYTFGRMYSPTTGEARMGYRPSKKSIKRTVDKIHALTEMTST